MENKKINNLQEKFKQYFDEMSYFQKYNVDIWITIVAILIVTFVVMYTFTISRISIEKLNWEKNKCNPFYMPFGKHINNGSDSFNKDNLTNCLNDLMLNVAFDVMSPINAIINFFSEILKFMSSIFTHFLAWIMHLFNLLLSLFRELVMRIQRIIKENLRIFAAINDFIGLFLGFVSIMYYKLVLLVDSIKLIFPMTALSFLTAVVLPSVITLAISIVLLALFYVIAVTLSPVFCIGCWAWAPVITWSVAVVFMFIYTTLMFVLYVIFANTCTEILQKTLTPISNDDSSDTYPTRGTGEPEDESYVPEDE
tara:strand:+ start:3579 stop:4508 length:930 start_codon:yes stop_codon:yes gene_type:complete